LKEMTLVVDGFDGVIDHPDGAVAPMPSIQVTLAALTGPQRSRDTVTTIPILAFIIFYPFREIGSSVKPLPAFKRRVSSADSVP
jgi:hypothetical protein